MSEKPRVEFVGHDRPETPYELHTQRLVLRRWDMKVGGQHFDITVKGDPCLVGMVELRYERGATEAAVGWQIFEQFRRQGYATEAAARILDLAFRDRGMRRVFAAIDTQNSASIRVAQKLGMLISIRDAKWLAYAVESWWISQGGQHAARV